MNFQKYLTRQAEKFGDKPALIFEDEPTTFSELRDLSFKLADYLIKTGLKKGDKVTVFLPNSHQTVISYFGVFAAGFVLVPLDFMLTEEEIITFVKHSESKALIIQAKKGINLQKIKERCPGLKETIMVRPESYQFSSLENILRDGVSDTPPVLVQEDDLSSIFYTSGSTGHPKGVMLTYGHFDSPVKVLNYLDLSSDDVLLCAGLPFSHLGGFVYLPLFLHLGETLVVMPRFVPLEVLRLTQKYKVSFFWMVPSMYIAILSLKEADKYDLSSLRWLNVFGAPSSPFLLKKFHKMCPNTHLMNGWGMTETVGPACFAQPGITDVASIGRFMQEVEAKSVDSNGDSLPVNTPGELWVRGKAVMTGYYKEPGLTSEAITEDGWLKTGDIAKVTDEGLWYIVGRKKDMIKVAGEIVFSPEVEEKILLYPKIKEAAVIGVPDKLRGEVPKAFLVLKDNEELDEPELKEFLKKHLAHFKLPACFEVFKELPKNRAGKIDKVKLRKAR